MFTTQLDISADLEMDKMRWESYVSTFCSNENLEINKTFINLAHYASFPIVLSSDLLYKIYINFIASRNKSEKTLQIWEASEFLFSPIIKELGYDLFEIHPGVRQSLKNKLKDKLLEKAEYAENIRMAFFMKEYAEKCKNNFQSDQIEKAQILNYEIELNPEKAVTEVLKRISEAKGKPVGNHVGYLLEYGKSKLGGATNTALKNQIESAEALLKGINKQDSTDIENALKGFDIGEETGDGIKILIPTDVKIARVDKNPTKRKLRALVISIDKPTIRKNKMNEFPFQQVDKNSAELFAKKINSLLPAFELDCKEINGEKCTKENILFEFENLKKSVNKNDDIVIYISGFAQKEYNSCEIACYSLINRKLKNDNDLFLRDEEIGELIKEIVCESITIILQFCHSASPYWLENTIKFKSKTIVFASCKFGQNPLAITQNKENLDFCEFTYALVDSMTKGKNNRNIFADTIQKISKYSEGEKSSKNIVLENKTPVLIGSTETYNLNFIKGADEDYLLKNQLFKANFTNKTAYELSSTECESLKKSHLKDHNKAQDLSNKLQEVNKLNSELPPIFLLIYSDHIKNLEHLKKEKTEILNLLATLNVLVLLLENPDSVAFSNLMKSAKYRNRIQLIYYAGYDDNEGNMYLNEKAFNIDEFAALLDYQENIKIFFSNTCRSKLYAEYLAQMGVKYSYGFEGEVSDQIAAEKGVEFFRKLAINGSILNLELKIR